MFHQIRLEDDVYERIKANKRDENQVSEMREAIEQADQRERDEGRDVAKRFE